LVFEHFRNATESKTQLENGNRQQFANHLTAHFNMKPIKARGKAKRVRKLEGKAEKLKNRRHNSCKSGQAALILIMPSGGC